MRTDIDSSRSVIEKMQNDIRSMNKILIANVNGLKDAQAQIEAEKSIIRDDTNLKEIVEKIQIFLKKHSIGNQ